MAASLSHLSEGFCSSCKRITKYQCLKCSVKICNDCSTFENNEDVQGLKMGKAVGYCEECFLTKTESDDGSISDTESKTTKDKVQHSESFHGSSDESDEPTGSETIKKNPKKRGRRGNWTMDSLNDFIDIIVSDEYNKKKLIFTNTKNQKNAAIYQKILTELKKRCAERGEEFEATVPQLRNKFKKCVTECKKAALTIKTATGIKRFQGNKGFGNWFNQLFQLVKCRDSCQPDQAVEPSAHLSESESKSEDASNNQGATTEQFIPIRTKKVKKEDILKSTHDLIKKTLEMTKRIACFS